MKEFIKKNQIYIILVIALILCIFRALKGFCWTDESFYLSTADRFYRGDALLKTEWYRTQLSSVICLPFYALYMFVTGSNEGVILFFRFLYLILSTVTAFVAYKVVKKEYPESLATIIALFIMFYAHLNVTALSYYMMSIDFLLMALFIVYDHYHNNSNKKLIVAGVLFALSVLSLPSFAVAYFIGVFCWMLVVLANKVFKLPKEIKEGIEKAQIMKIIGYTFIGICIPALIFAIYLLSRVSISEIITAIPNITYDKEHAFTFGYCVRRFFFSVSDVYGKWTYVAYILMGLCLFGQKFIKKTKIADIIVICDIALFVIYAIKSYGHTGYIQTAICLFALPIFFMSNKKNMPMFMIFVPTGLALSMTYSFSSSDFLYVLAIGHFAVALACICFLYDYVDGRKAILCGEKSDKIEGRAEALLYKGTATLLSLVVLYALAVTIALRMTSVYRDAPIPKLDTKIASGIAKGLYTTEEHLGYYEDAYSVIEEYMMSDSEGVSPDSTIMFSKILPWGYMVSDLKCGYPSTWRATAYNAEQLEAYYEANPGREPDIILVLDEEIGSYDASGDVEDDHNPNLDEMNDYWKQYIIDKDMKETRVKCGVLYNK